MRLAMLTTRATVQGPLPQTHAALADALRRHGCEVELAVLGASCRKPPAPGQLWGALRTDGNEGCGARWFRQSSFTRLTIG
jgi:hypothetical protein